MERLLASTSSSGVEPSWPQLLGSNNWDGLLDPLNLDLRHLILRCGNFSEATYDAFESDVKSKYAGTSKFGKEHFFDKVTLDSAQDYQVACFLYATADGFIARRLLTRSKAHDPWDNKSNFMGYIATTTDQRSRALGRREIYVVWRGTVANSEWRAEFVHPCLESLDKLLPPDEHHGSSCCCCTHKAKVMSGWLKIYLSSHPGSPFVKLSARQQVKRKIQELVGVYKNENVSIIVTGHSLGASLAVLSAFDLVKNCWMGAGDIPVSAIVFACPKVGNCAFSNMAKALPNLKILHIKNKHDWVPILPPLPGYVDTAIKQLVVDNNKSTYLRKTSWWKLWSLRIWDCHNLEALLHVIAGWNGPNGDFELKVTRSVALVNKSSDFLQRPLIPESWFVDKNKGLLRHHNGDWDYAPRSPEDEPVPEF